MRGRSQRSGPARLGGGAERISSLAWRESEDRPRFRCSPLSRMALLRPLYRSLAQLRYSSRELQFLPKQRRAFVREMAVIPVQECRVPVGDAGAGMTEVLIEGEDVRPELSRQDRQESQDRGLSGVICCLIDTALSRTS